MNATGSNALGQYRTVNAWGAVNGDRMQLVLRMMDGALERITSARGHLERNEIAAKGEAIGKAVGLIEGLRVALDRPAGGEIAENLGSLYDYMTRRLTEANLRNDPHRLAEVADLLGVIRSGWEAVMRNPPAEAHAG